MLAGADAGPGVRGHVWEWGGGFGCSAPQYGRDQEESGGTHTHTHRGTHRNVHANVAPTL